MKKDTSPPCQRAFTASIGLSLLCALALFVPARGQSATIQFYMTNSLGVADTNAFYVRPVSTPILADGSWLVTGVPVRITPDVNGFAQTNLQRGNWVVSNAFVVGNWGTGVNPIGGQRGVVFAVPNSSGTYSFTSNAISGGNVYNYNGAQFVATYSNIVTELGFVPLSTNDARAIFPTNTIAAGSNITLSTNTGVITIASTATGGAGTNTVSAGTLVTVVTNSPNYVVSALSQTNGFTSITTSNAASFAVTNDGRILNFTNLNNSFSARTITNGSLFFAENQGGYWRMKTNGAANLQLDNSTDSGVIIFQTDGSVHASSFIQGDTVTAELAITGDGTGVSNVTAKAVLAAVTNQWRLDATNAVTGIATTNTYIAGSGLTFSTNGKPVTVSVTEGTTNRFALTNYVFNVSNNVVTASNALSVYALGISNRYDVLFPTNSGTDGQLVTKSGTNVYWSTVTGGSGTGVQTNAGTGTNNTFTTIRIRNTNANFTMTSTLAAGPYLAALSGDGHNLDGSYSTVAGGLSNGIAAGTASFIGGGFQNIIPSGNLSDVIVGGQSNTIQNYYGFIGGGTTNVILGNWGVVVGGGGNIAGASGINSFNSIGGGRQNFTAGNWNVVAGGFSNSVGIYTDSVDGSAVLGGVSNLVRGDYSVAMGHNATVNTDHNSAFVWSDGRAAVSGNSNTFTIYSLNGVSINTNAPSGNALNVIGGGISATNFNVQGDPFIYWNTNVVSVRGAGSIALDGTYVYLGSRYTNYLTGSTITNNAGTWIMLNPSLQSAYSFAGTSPVSTNWTLGVGSAPPPRTFFGGYFDLRGFYVLGDFDSTNLAKLYVHPTNAPTDGQFVVASGNNQKWSSTAAITNITGSSSLATNVINGFGSIAANFGGTIYMSPSGSDSAAGTVAAPLATLGQAFTNLGGHGTIVVRGGSYTGQAINGANAGRLTVRAYPGETPNFFFGESIASNSFTHLSNGIFTATLTASQSNSINFLSNRWNDFAPTRNSKIVLFQTNYPFGSNTNNLYLPLPAVYDRSTQTNRCPSYPLLYTNSISAMTNLDGFWSVQGGTIYVKFGTSNAVGGLQIPGTNSYESVIYNLAPSADIELIGISSWYGWRGFDLSGAGKVRLVRLRAIGAGEVGITVRAVANSATEAEIIGCDTMLNLGQGLQIGSLIDGSSFVTAQRRNNVIHDNYREGSMADNNVSQTVMGDFSAYNGLADRAHSWVEGGGFGFVDDGSESVYIGCTSKSNSATGWQLGTAIYIGARSQQRLFNCLAYKDNVSMSVDDSADAVSLVGCALDPIQISAVNVSANPTTHGVRSYLSRVTQDSQLTSVSHNPIITGAGVTIDGTRYAVETEAAADTTGSGGLATELNAMRLIGSAETRLGTGVTLYNDGFAKFSKGVYFNAAANVPAAVGGNDGSLVISNQVVYWVTSTKTNLVSDGR